MLLACADDASEPAGTPDAHAGDVADADISSAQVADAGVTRIDRAHLNNTGSAPLDYGDPALWMCRPGNDPNECLQNLDATEFLIDGSPRVERHVPAPQPAFDCFYVYPTVDTSGVGNKSDLSDIALQRDALLTQAARFSRICEVYAPLYRQRTFNLMNQLTGDEQLAYADVEAAFRYYLERLSRDRKFVIIGHSQGTGILTRMIAERIDGDEQLRARLISAVLIGGSILAPEGRNVGGTFQHLPLCTAPGQVGCVIAFGSFARERPPNPEANLNFVRSPAGSVNGCTNPSLLAGNTGRYRGSYLPAMASHPLFVPNVPSNTLPSVATLLILVRDLFRGECIQRDGLSYLEIWPDPSSDDRRPVPPYRYSVQEQIGIGLHTGDFSVVMGDLIDAVELQARAAAAM